MMMKTNASITRYHGLSMYISYDGHMELVFYPRWSVNHEFSFFGPICFVKKDLLKYFCVLMVDISFMT